MMKHVMIKLPGKIMLLFDRGVTRGGGRRVPPVTIRVFCKLSNPVKSLGEGGSK